jgi:spore coat protein U-like protein
MKKELNKTKGVFVKKTKMSLAKSTTALTCLVGALIISSDLGAQTTTTTGSMAVATSVAASCTISAGTMTFAAYTASLITATSEITANCTNGTNYSISLSETPDSTPTYYLYRGGTVSATASNQLGVIFSHTGGTMVGATVAITGTGSGASQTAGTITGSIAGSQTGKTAGSFTRTMTLNLVY